MTLPESLNDARQFIQSFAAGRGLLNDTPTQALLDELDRKNRFFPDSVKAMLCWEYFLIIDREDINVKLNAEEQIKLNNCINNLLIALLEHMKENNT